MTDDRVRALADVRHRLERVCGSLRSGQHSIAVGYEQLALDISTLLDHDREQAEEIARWQQRWDASNGDISRMRERAEQAEAKLAEIEEMLGKTKTEPSK